MMKGEKQMKAELVMTVEEMKNREAWLALRNTGLGGSDAAVITGMSKWKSPITLWMEKTGQKEPDDLSDNQRVQWGIKLEPIVADAFCEQTGKKVMRRGMMRSIDHTWMLANVDRVIVGENAGLECKTAGVDQAKYWRDDNMPDGYYLQCQWYMAVTGCDKWYVAVLIGGNEFKWKEIPRNEEEIQSLIKAGEKFWDYIKNNVMPPVDGSSDCSTALAKTYPGGEAGQTTVPEDLVKQFHDAKQLLSLNEAAVKKLENQIKETMGDFELAYAGDTKITWKTQAGRVTVDSKRLKAEQPAVYETYSKVGNPVRVFMVS